MKLREPRRRRRKSVTAFYILIYEDEPQMDEFADVGEPRNLGRRRPHIHEWDDYILEEQGLWREELAARVYEKPKRKRRRKVSS